MRFRKVGGWYCITGEDYYYGSGETSLGTLQLSKGGDWFFQPEHETNSPLTCEQLQKIVDKMEELEHEGIMNKLSELEAKVAKQSEFIKKIHLYAWSEGLSLEEFEQMLEGE